MQKMIAQSIQEQQEKYDPNRQLLAVRSSSTLEDLDKMAGAGLFDSILNVQLNDKEQFKKAILDVWLSLYNQRAVISRKQNKISTCIGHMAVLVQQMIDSEYSFIIHSTNPINDDKNQVYIELACGQGETLASANQSGTPYRAIYDKKTKAAEVVAFSNY